ncbi:MULTISPECIES: hypothetical protein [unclassified Sphingomonas]|uniref:hypothetical protein n=1 Tax=unclassified Sphingomonas TaxID=196159 RepID=UPI00226A6E6D|nr:MULTISPECIES: hypothetical protein [unclassified Sphingomonas]
MPQSAIPSLLALLAAITAADSRMPQPPPQPGLRIQQMTIHERIIIRVPRVDAGAPYTPVPLAAWKEKKGPKCLIPGHFAGAMISGPGIVDIMLDDGRRMRAKLDRDCRPLDYYPGFYIKPGIDGQVCADRDSIRVRSGASCGIDSFKLLKAKR